ncbi:hypothetical protein D0T51_00190 [Parabacteroides sp. 52]|uniref:hypothetical protein n=1 Tax=unclassified Parabacteroides TaxID=2649774 RepID=UPI0013D5B2B3|nr:MULTISPECIES: hypothetical protein [unclassified Parabacteroides]MDH6533397.1 putative membrane channel-forming protein YqfA (hemolysin III family) [Parabacteroides sp. PM5-20]NDV54155.1 hypothetical protein [Parabacteroides sp. 52]
MSKKTSGKTRIYLYVLLTIAGCILACTSIIPNDYLKLTIVMVTLCIGLYGIMKGLSASSNSEETTIGE